MQKILRGKYLVKSAVLQDGTKVLTITGVFTPNNFDIAEISESDEMWVSDIIISGAGLRFTEPIGTNSISPEDFLEGVGQLPKCWSKKTNL